MNEILRLHELQAGYHGGTVLHGVNLTMERGAVHAVVGHNGAGKTTLLNTVSGLLSAKSGSVHVDGADVTGLAAHRRARRGLGYVPQGRRVFASVTVAEHLAISYRRPRHDSPEWTRKRVLELFPALAARSANRGSQLSGGEQQMLAIARALLSQPRLILLDEPVEGLAPAVTHQINDTIAQLADNGVAVLLTAPQPELPVALADHIDVLTGGRVTLRVTGPDARADDAVLRAALSPALGPPTHAPQP